ncbi:MAG: hypothetical protein GQ574_11765 [Crocinitomix sp.]|nr:hypothetical protein [Crocinitomix sp.]
MKYFYGLFLLGLMLSCSEEIETTGPDNLFALTDTISTSIIEYDLNEDRLSAVEYSNELSFAQQRAYDQINVLFLSDPTTISQNFDNAVFDIGLKVKDISNIPVYEGGQAFQKAVTNLLQFYNDELTNGFIKILPLLEKGAEERSRDEEYRVIDYDEQFAIKEVVFFDAIAVEQEKFAQANNFRTQEL